ncbi:MAG: UDP-galactopyranose mutase, partial [Lachnospiraceae bacterium]|nr:UDP-galactopyranose mutase [Lachnospiraceae bacterium]
GIEVRTGVDYFKERESLRKEAVKVVFTGQIDAYFDYSLGELEYRSLRFETETLEIPSFQGNAVVNYTEFEVPYTRIIEHKFFEKIGNSLNDLGNKTVITREYPKDWTKGDEPYYPVNDEKNTALYNRYSELAAKEENVIFGGRLGKYKYYDMDDVIADALYDVKAEMAGF